LRGYLLIIDANVDMADIDDVAEIFARTIEPVVAH
jgi:hypothetical protein